MSQFKVKVTHTSFFTVDTSDYESDYEPEDLEEEDDSPVSEAEALAQFAKQVESGDISVDDGYDGMITVKKV